jgi:hypothetical protein
MIISQYENMDDKKHNSPMHDYMPQSYLPFEARNPRTMDSTVGTLRQEDNLRNEKSSTGKSLSAGCPSTIGLAIAGSGIRIYCPPGFGAGTVRSK